MTYIVVGSKEKEIKSGKLNNIHCAGVKGAED
jgi:hypothetical protein